MILAGIFDSPLYWIGIGAIVVILIVLLILRKRQTY